MFTKEDDSYRLALDENVRIRIWPQDGESHLAIHINHGSFHFYLKPEEVKALAEMLFASQEMANA
jgi:hypothetical protein